MNEQYRNLNSQIDALYAQMDVITADDNYDAQWYEQVAEEQVSLMWERDELLASIILTQYNERFSVPITPGRAMELAQHANTQRDNRTRGVEA